MKNYVRFSLYLKQPVKMGTQGSQSSTIALSYIAGSTLRGAIISLYAKKYFQGVVLDQDEKAKSELFTDTCFFDAYVKSAQGSDTIPVPAVYYCNKHTMRQREKEVDGKAVEDYTVQVFSSPQDTFEDAVQRIDFGSFCKMDDDGYTLVKVRKVGRLHNKRGEEKDIFRYEAIDEEQAFEGYIRCADEEVAQRYIDAINKETVYLGGSKGSGYGRVYIDDVACCGYDEIKQFLGIKTKIKEGLFSIYALSNLNLISDMGDVTGSIDEKWLETKLGIHNVKLVYSSTGIVNTGGFNHKWKAAMPQNSAVAAGSWFVFSYEGELNKERLASVEENGIGQRRQEGFGRILFNLDVGEQEVKRYIVKPNKEPTESISPTLQEKEKEILEKIRLRVNQQRLTKMISSAALKTAEKI